MLKTRIFPDSDASETFERLRPKLVRVARSVTQSSETAEDIVQDSYLKFWLILNSRFRHLPDFADRFGLLVSCCHHTSFAARLGGRGGFARLAEVPEQRR